MTHWKSIKPNDWWWAGTIYFQKVKQQQTTNYDRIQKHTFNHKQLTAEDSWLMVFWCDERQWIIASEWPNVNTFQKHKRKQTNIESISERSKEDNPKRRLTRQAALCLWWHRITNCERFTMKIKITFGRYERMLVEYIQSDWIISISICYSALQTGSYKTPSSNILPLHGFTSFRRSLYQMYTQTHKPSMEITENKPKNTITTITHTISSQRRSCRLSFWS